MTILDVPMTAPSALQIVWLILIAVLWIGFFFLEGFDFGVGMLIPFAGKTDQDRRVAINTVGPHWDGNEVWLLTAGGAMFAAFPGWYATLFSGLYLPLFLVLLGLIIRGVAFEYRSKREDAKWRTTWDWLAAIGAFLPPLVLGVGFARFFEGMTTKPHTTAFGNTVPLYGGTLGGLDALFSPFALIGGVMLVALFVAHGAHFMALKTKDAVHETAQGIAKNVGLVALVLLLVFVVYGNLRLGMSELPGHPGWLKIAGWVAGVLSVAALAFAWWMNSKKRDGMAFIGSGLSVVLLVVMYFTAFYPGLGFNNTATMDTPLDITTASSSPLTLKLMTIFACIMVPVVLAYTVWSYWVFRRRLNTMNIPALEVTTAA